MNKFAEFLIVGLPLALLSSTAGAQVPVDDNGNPIGAYQPATNQALTGNEGIPLLTPGELQDLVGPVALYPDDLLAIVLPAAAYPLQIVQAARFLEDLEDDPTLQPDSSWDDAIIALINYPEVIALLNEDLDWTWQLGEAVVAQQADVVSAIEVFRNRAYAAGNLRSDEYQQVGYDDGIIEITPISDDVIYVPYYEPERVVVRQPRRVYYYYPEPCPVYYYPYPDSYSFRRGYFWGVTTAFTIGWASDRLRVYHPSYSGHPYYGRHYWNRWYYRRPSITVYNNIYINNRRDLASRRYTYGDYWRPSRHTRLRYSDQRITRTRGYDSRRRTVTNRTVVRDNTRTTVRRQTTRRSATPQRESNTRRGTSVRRESSTTTRRSSSQRSRSERRADTNAQTRQPRQQRSHRERSRETARASTERSRPPQRANRSNRESNRSPQRANRERAAPERQARRESGNRRTNRESQRRSESTRPQRSRSESRRREDR